MRTPLIDRQPLQQCDIVKKRATASFPPPEFDLRYRTKIILLIITSPLPIDTLTMPYKSAILAAIENLKDHETGSPAAAIRRYMQDRKDDIIAAAATSAMANQHSGRQSAIFHTSAMDESAQCNDHYKANTGSITSTSTPVSTGGGGSSIASSSSSAWNETLFQTTLKSLLTKNILVQVNGSNYKYSDAYLKKRAERLREQMEEEEQHRRHHHQEYQQQKHHHYSLSSSASDVAATTSSPSSSSHTLFPREEPPKPSPKKKTLHAKVKLKEGEIITVINPPTTSQQQHHNANEMMETEDDATMNANNNISPMTLESDAYAANNAKESIKKQPHVKIIPRKVVGGTKKMYVS
jgi:hypothetical protein